MADIRFEFQDPFVYTRHDQDWKVDEIEEEVVKSIWMADVIQELNRVSM